MFCLIATHQQDQWTYEVPDAESSLGSATENDFVLPVHGVSRHHAVVRRLPGGVEVLDAGSKNGLCLGGVRLQRVFLAPGSGIQVGEAWLELVEISSIEGVRPLRSEVGQAQCGEGDAHDVIPPKPLLEAALGFAQYLVVSGPGLPGQRSELLARALTVLGGVELLTIQRDRSRRFLVRERVGSFSDEGEALAHLLGKRGSPFVRHEVRLKRYENVLVAGRDQWFIVARFASTDLARARSRRDFLRFLATTLLSPGRALKKLVAEELGRVMALTGGNKSKAARQLSVTRQTIDNMLARARRSTLVEPQSTLSAPKSRNSPQTRTRKR